MSRQIAQPLGHYELATDEALALALQGVIKSGCGLSSWKWGQECPQNPQAGKPALRVAQTFLSAGSGDFPVARPSPTFNHTPGHRPVQMQLYIRPSLV